MIVIPAVDLLEGAAVRLERGIREAATIYSEDPPAMIREFASAGAALIHVVDLDGAFAGHPVQTPLIREMVAVAAEHGARIQVGGGVRERDSAVALLELGVSRVVVGTLAAREPQTVEQLCGDYPGRCVVAVDAREGEVAVAGWTEQTRISAVELARRAESWGAAAVLFTDVARDGLQVGPAVAVTAALQGEVGIPVIASGGIASLSDLRALRDAGIREAVVGRAIYERNFTVQEALAPC